MTFMPAGRGAIGSWLILCFAVSGCETVDSSSSAALSPPFPPATPASIVAVTKAVFPAVVRLDVVKIETEDGKQIPKRSIGSGVIIDNDGHVLTNFHVAGHATEINVTLFSKERVRAKLVGDDHWTDLAVVQLDMNDVQAKHVQFTAAKWGTSSKLIPGQDVMAIGTPFGLARTMTLGTVSTTDRTFYPQRLMIDDYETGGYSNWIQMDVPINPGNSGGPLVDLDGTLVGINTRGGAQNLNFAVPIDTAKPIVDAILRTATADRPGHFDRSDLGLDLQPMQDLELVYKLDANEGVLVNAVDPFSGAQSAGVQAQDVLLAINGKPTNARFPEELAAIQQQIAALPLNQTAKLTLQRGQKHITLDAKAELLRGTLGDQKDYPNWGISAREVTPKYAGSHQLPAVAGAIVTTVLPNSVAADGGLMTDDVIIAIDGKDVADLERFEQFLPSTRPSKVSPTSTLFTLLRGRGRRSVLLKVPAKETGESAEAN